MLFFSFFFFDEFSSLIARIVLIPFLFLFTVCWCFGDDVFGVQRIFVALLSGL